jgi:dienelactone hydrolase
MNAVVVLMVMLAGGEAEGSWERVGRDIVGEMGAQSWDKVTARFDATMAAALPAEQLGRAWRSLLADAGPFRGVTRATVADQAGMHVVVVTAAFEKKPADIKIALDGKEKIAGLFLIPAAADPATWQPPVYGRQPVVEKAVTVGPFKLPGKLMLPQGRGPWPAVVLVHGSGPSDEDETVGASRPFRDLALGLAAHGVASLRYVKRTAHAPASFGKTFTLHEETIDDARAAVALLSGGADIDHRRIFVLGHSLGGYAAPRIAAGDPQVAGIIILAGSTRPLDVLLVEQIKYLSPALLPKAEETARAIRNPSLAAHDLVDVLGAKLPGSYFLDMRSHDPTVTVAGLKVPVLVLQGERDYQVGRADYDGWARALAGHGNARLKLYPRLNHLFASGTGPSRPEEYLRPDQHVDEEVVRDVVSFITTPPAAR